MALFEGVVGLGIACLLAPAIAEYAKLRVKAAKGFNWIGVSGVMFIFAGTFGGATALVTYLGSGIIAGIADLFSIVGWLFALIGTIFVGYEVLVEK